MTSTKEKIISKIKKSYRLKFYLTFFSFVIPNLIIAKLYYDAFDKHGETIWIFALLLYAPLIITHILMKPYRDEETSKTLIIEDDVK